MASADGRDESPNPVYSHRGAYSSRTSRVAPRWFIRLIADRSVTESSHNAVTGFKTSSASSVPEAVLTASGRPTKRAMRQIYRLLDKVLITDEEKQTAREEAARLGPAYRALPFDTKVEMYDYNQCKEVMIILAGSEREAIEYGVREMECDAYNAEMDMREYFNRQMGFTEEY